MRTVESSTRVSPPQHTDFLNRHACKRYAHGLLEQSVQECGYLVGLLLSPSHYKLIERHVLKSCISDSPLVFNPPLFAPAFWVIGFRHCVRAIDTHYYTVVFHCSHSHWPTHDRNWIACPF